MLGYRVERPKGASYARYVVLMDAEGNDVNSYIGQPSSGSLDPEYPNKLTVLVDIGDPKNPFWAKFESTSEQPQR